MSTNYDIYGIGAALLDTEIDVKDHDLKAMNIDKGVMTLVDEDRQNTLLSLLKTHLVHCKQTSGGSAANTIIAASYFGANTFYSCRVANDNAGQIYLDDLRQAGVDIHKQNGTQNGTTGKCLVMITPDAERTMNTFLGISELLSVDDIDEEALSQSRHLYIEGYLVSSVSGKAAAIKARELAEKHGTYVALSLSDPAMVQFFRDGLLEMIGDGVDMLFCNKEEALNFTQTETLEDACQALKSYSKQFAITLGADGAMVFDGQEHFNVGGTTANAIDTNGAGDMFAGAFLYAKTQGMNYIDATELANRAAAKVVAQYGPRLPSQAHKVLLNKT